MVSLEKKNNLGEQFRNSLGTVNGQFRDSSRIV